MRVFNVEKTSELESYDLTKGYLIEDKLEIKHDAIKGVEEQGHYETIAEYENGGKDVKWVVDIQGVEEQKEYIELEDILVYNPYTKEELDKIDKANLLEKLQNELSSTDYQAIKFAEGWYTEEEYAPIKEQREELRRQIRQIIDAN